MGTVYKIKNKCDLVLSYSLKNFAEKTTASIKLNNGSCLSHDLREGESISILGLNDNDIIEIDVEDNQNVQKFNVYFINELRYSNKYDMSILRANELLGQSNRLKQEINKLEIKLNQKERENEFLINKIAFETGYKFEKDSENEPIINWLDFDYSFDGFDKIQGKKILKATFTEDAIIFCTEEKEYKYNAVGDCCSSSFIESLDNIEAFENAILLGCEVAAGETKEVEEDYLVSKWTFYKFRTNKGFCTLSFRNDSNGYYNGNLEYVGEE